MHIKNSYQFCEVSGLSSLHLKQAELENISSSYPKPIIL